MTQTTKARDFILVCSFGKPIVGDFREIAKFALANNCTFNISSINREIRCIGQPNPLADISDKITEYCGHDNVLCRVK